MPSPAGHAEFTEIHQCLHKNGAKPLIAACIRLGLTWHAASASPGPESHRHCAYVASALRW